MRIFVSGLRKLVGIYSALLQHMNASELLQELPYLLLVLLYVLTVLIIDKPFIVTV